MIVFGTRSNGERRRRPVPVNADTYQKAEWLEGGSDPCLSPTVFLIEQPPDTVLVPHFHRQNQFQLFVGGGGALGRHPLRPVTVHYAGAYTGYGPLVSGAHGIQYFTIRPVLESGFVPVEGGRDRMLRGPKRHAQSAPVDPLDAPARRGLAAARVDTLIEPAADGLAAFAVALPPGATWVSPHTPASQGVFVFVIGGDAAVDGRPLGPWEHVFVSADAPTPPVVAGATGAQLVAMHTPPKCDDYLDAERAGAAGD